MPTPMYSLNIYTPLIPLNYLCVTNIVHISTSGIHLYLSGTKIENYKYGIHAINAYTQIYI